MTTNISLQACGRLVTGNNKADIYLKDPVSIHNINKLDNALNATVSGGSLVIASFPPTGIGIYNRSLGAIANINLSTSGVTYYSTFYDTNTKNSNVTISGSKAVGRI